MEWLERISEKFGGDRREAKRFRERVRNETSHALADESIYHALETLEFPYHAWEVARIARQIEIRKAKMDAASRQLDNDSYGVKVSGTDHAKPSENWLTKIIEKFRGNRYEAREFCVLVRSKTSKKLLTKSIYGALESLHYHYNAREVARLAQNIEMEQAKKKVADRAARSLEKNLAANQTSRRRKSRAKISIIPTPMGGQSGRKRRG